MNSAKKRVILAVTVADPGGVQSFLVKLATYLKNQDFDVLLLAGEGQWLFHQFANLGLPSIRLRHLKRGLNPWHDWLAFRELTRVFRELQPDIVYLNSSKMGALGSMAAHKAGMTRVIYRIGGWVFLEPLHPLLRKIYQWIETYTAQFKHTIVCVHPNDEAIARRMRIIPQKEIITIPNGIDLEAFDQNKQARASARRVLGLKEEDRVFGTVANLYPAKDLVRYLTACRLVHEKKPNAKFIILGEGPERKKIEQKRRELGLASRVLLLGARDDALSLLSAFDVFVLPSAKEGMPWALLEAMAAELPCIATNVGAHAWMLGNEAGWIVPPQDPQHLAQAMLEALHDPEEARRRGQKAREEVQNRFPLQKTLEKNGEVLSYFDNPKPRNGLSSVSSLLH